MRTKTEERETRRLYTGMRPPVSMTTFFRQAAETTATGQPALLLSLQLRPLETVSRGRISQAVLLSQLIHSGEEGRQTNDTVGMIQTCLK